MLHLPQLISDLALILAAAGIVTLIFKKLNQPVVLGYIIAGLIVGPQVPFVPSVTEVSSIQIWAEIGVIFLLFALGLEFSFKKLANVGGEASVTAIVEVVVMVLVGFAVGQLFGWSSMDSLFLGGILSISSTTIIIRAFDELKIKSKGFVSLVFGVLVVEDIVAILLMVLLSTVAISQTFSGTEMVFSVAKLIFFLVIWFLLGIFLLPTLFKRIKTLVNEESLLVIALALCFLMVVLATHVGFSAALGAFIMGSILAETEQGSKIEHTIKPVKDLFAAIFFVSVGMQINFGTLSQYIIPVLAITFITIIGKTLSTSLGAIIAGRSLKHSVQSGMSLAQIGEFSFIIAGLGLTLKVTSDFLYPVAVGVSAITTFTTPYMIKSSDRIHKIIEKLIPRPIMNALSRYSSETRIISGRSDWAPLMKSYLSLMIFNSTVVIAIFLSCANYLVPLLQTYIQSEKLSNSVGLVSSLIFASPFLWALVLGGKRNESTGELWSATKHRGPLFVLEVSRWVVALLLLVMLSAQFVTFEYVISGFFIFTLVFVFLFARHLSTIYTWMESRFVENLSGRKNIEGENRPDYSHLAPWDAHLVYLDIPHESQIGGKTLMDLSIRERFGLTIALILRGKRLFVAPSRDEQIFPLDKIGIIGTDDQIAKFKSFIEDSVNYGKLDSEQSDYSLQAVSVGEDSFFQRKSIRDSGIRESTKGLVVGLERKGQRFLNPDSQMTISSGDLLWIVGSSKSLKELGQKV